MKKKENKKGQWVYCPFPESTHWRDPSGFECTLGDVVESPNGYEFVVVKSDYDVWGLLGSTDSFCQLTNCNLTGYKKISNINDKQEPKMKVELIQKTTLTDMYYKIVVNGEFHMSYNDYDEAVRAYDKIKSAIPREEVILSKEI
jgi:hypothetical protein